MNPGLEPDAIGNIAMLAVIPVWGTETFYFLGKGIRIGRMNRDVILGSEFGASESSDRTPAKPNESGLN
jgi:hypothetical protein